MAGWIPSATPKEVGETLRTEALKEMTDAYCAARYDLVHPVSPEQGAKAQAAMLALRRRK